ncbi:unnamed protein product [Effrenium voratum]|nr:unnamed protein product [Effrenium voratum]
MKDVDLGRWRCAAPGWALARLVEMGGSLADWDPKTLSTWRHPVIVRNALPVALVFGQPGVPEALELPSGGQRGYVWGLDATLSTELTGFLGLVPSFE